MESRDVIRTPSVRGTRFLPSERELGGWSWAGGSIIRGHADYTSGILSLPFERGHASAYANRLSGPRPYISSGQHNSPVAPRLVIWDSGRNPRSFRDWRTANAIPGLRKPSERGAPFRCCHQAFLASCEVCIYAYRRRASTLKGTTVGAAHLGGLTT